MDRDPGDQQRASLRASDADRERLVEALREHYAQGRLTDEELAQRSERAYTARTLGDLDALGADLPPLPAAPPAQAPSPRLRQARAVLVSQAAGSLVLVLMLVVIWALSGRGYFWPAWAIFGIAVALAWRAVGVSRPHAETERSRRRDR
jgi:hypothetical protein